MFWMGSPASTSTSRPSTTAREGGIRWLRHRGKTGVISIELKWSGRDRRGWIRTRLSTVACDEPGVTSFRYRIRLQPQRRQAIPTLNQGAGCQHLGVNDMD